MGIIIDEYKKSTKEEDLVRVIKCIRRNEE